MDCQHFDERLDQLLDGSCAADAWALAAGHAENCPRCRHLLDAVTGRLDEQDADVRARLTLTVLARTSGSTCRAAHDRLCAYVDAALPPDDRELVAGHLAECAACRSLAAALAEVAVVLPTFASADPGGAFTTRVLARTTRRVPEPRVTTLAARWWGRVTARPRFALEVAYVLTLVLMIVVGNPVAAFRDSSSRAVEVARPGVERVVTAVLDPMAAAGSNGLARARVAVRSLVSAGPSTGPVTGEGTSLVRRWFAMLFGRSLDALLGRLWDAAAGVKEAWDRLWAIGRSAAPSPAPAKPGGNRAAPRTEPAGGPAR